MIRIPSALVILCTLVGIVRADSSWQPPDTLSGLVGTYARLDPAQPSELVYVTLGGSDGDRADGPYTRFVTGPRGNLVLQTGTYRAIGANPAIGAIMTFVDDDGQLRDSYAILGLRRAAGGQKIAALELVAPDGNVIALYRVGL